MNNWRKLKKNLVLFLLYFLIVDIIWYLVSFSNESVICFFADLIALIVLTVRVSFDFSFEVKKED